MIHCKDGDCHASLMSLELADAGDFVIFWITNLV